MECFSTYYGDHFDVFWVKNNGKIEFEWSKPLAPLWSLKLLF